MRKVEHEIKNEERKIKQDVLITDLKKQQFIDEIKSGLGEVIMEEPNKIQKKLNFLQKLKRLLS